jgi:hypothetical protein
MAEVIARVRKEMKDRLREIEAELAAVEALVAEKARLERALAAPPFADADAAPARKPRRATQPRAPRGANRAAVYAALETMPGASVGELAAASGVGRPQVYALLRKGVEEGRVKTDELAGGQTGYRIAAQPETAFPTPEPPADEPEPEPVVAEAEPPSEPEPEPVVAAAEPPAEPALTARDAD